MRRPAALAHVDEQIRRLLDLTHPDPHSVLGIHPDGDGVVVRAYRPDAEQVTILPDFGGRVPADVEHGVRLALTRRGILAVAADVTE